MNRKKSPMNLNQCRNYDNVLVQTTAARLKLHLEYVQLVGYGYTHHTTKTVHKEHMWKGHSAQRI